MTAAYDGWLNWSKPDRPPRPALDLELERLRAEQEYCEEQEAGVPDAEESLPPDDPNAPEPTAGDLVIAEGPSPELAARVEEVIFEPTPAGPRVDAELQPPSEPGTHRGEVREHDGALWRWARQHRKSGRFRADDGSTSANEAWHWVRTRKHTAAGGR